MTEHRKPKPCHHDRHLGERVTRDHTETCPTHADPPASCPGADGCAPCPEDHCVMCGRTHTDPTHPLTCPECVGVVRKDLDDIRWFARHLRWQAARGNSLLTAGARIPGGDAMVLLARAGAGWDDLHVARGLLPDDIAEDHHADDLVPVLLTLLGWEHQWRTHLGHQVRNTDRSPVTAITHYLADQLTTAAQTTDGPDWQGFTADMAALRRQLEGVLHDEKEPQRGVPCFECGDRLVRRFGDPKPCRHATPARKHLGDVEREARAAAARAAVLRTYPELGAPTYADLRAARRTPTSGEEAAARAPCGRCIESKTGQGGIEDPSVGQSWECIGCRKHYTPGEYANAVRADLLRGGPDGGWTHINMAAEAVSTQTGLVFPPATVRRWMDRTKVASQCMWSYTVDGATPGARSRGLGSLPAPDVPRPRDRPTFGAIVEEFAGRVAPSSWGLRLVFWPDVAEEAAKAVVRHYEAEEARRVRVAEAKRFYAALDQLAKEPTDKRAMKIGAKMGIHPSRVRAFIDERDAAKARAAAGDRAS